MKRYFLLALVLFFCSNVHGVVYYVNNGDTKTVYNQITNQYVTVSQGYSAGSGTVGNAVSTIPEGIVVATTAGDTIYVVGDNNTVYTSVNGVSLLPARTLSFVGLYSETRPTITITGGTVIFEFGDTATCNYFRFADCSGNDIFKRAGSIADAYFDHNEVIDCALEPDAMYYSLGDGGSCKNNYVNNVSFSDVSPFVNRGVALMVNNTFDSVFVNRAGFFDSAEKGISNNIFVNCSSLTNWVSGAIPTWSANLYWNNSSYAGTESDSISADPYLVANTPFMSYYGVATDSNVGLEDTALVSIISFNDYTPTKLSELINQSEFSEDTFAKSIANYYSLAKSKDVLSDSGILNETTARILNFGHFATDTAALILSDSSAFAAATQVLIFSSSPFDTDRVNLVLLSSSYTDSLTTTGLLIVLDTSVIIYPVEAQTYTDTDFFLIDWTNVKGAIGQWKVEYDTDNIWTDISDSNIIIVNNPATANVSQFYKQLANDLWYLRVTPYSVVE